jgi:peptide/nickel transport system permease protein
VAADWGYFPIAGYSSGIGGYAFLVLPIIIYAIISFGPQMRFNRILMLDEIGQDYVRTAKAKGLNQNSILFKHVLRNALIPLITRWAVVIPNLYLGSLVLESFFGIPGLGGITVQAVTNRDPNMIRALVFIGTLIYIFSTLLADVLYAVVDPRVKLK